MEKYKMIQTTNQILYIYIYNGKTYLEISILIFKTWDINHASGAPGNIGHRFGQIAVSTNTSVGFLHQPVAKNSDTTVHSNRTDHKGADAWSLTLTELSDTAVQPHFFGCEDLEIIKY